MHPLAENLAGDHPSAASTESTDVVFRKKATCIVCSGQLEKRLGQIFDTRFGIPDIREARRCTRCGLEQLFPIPSAAEIKSLYESYYNFGGERGTLYTNLREWFFSSSLYRFWIWLDGDISFHRRQGAGHLLDIGCNEGRGLRIYRHNGFEVEGLELNETAAAVARESGFSIHTERLNDFRPNRLFDVAVLSNVLEHSLEPGIMLADVRRLLKIGGQLWVSCPNSRSWLRSLFGRFWINWHVPFHISHFSPEVLRSLLSESGFGQIEIRQITPSLWVASSIVARLFARRGKPTRQLRNPFLIFGLVLMCRVIFFPFLFFGNILKRGDCLVAVARSN